eukprot:scaffold8620_cov62-Phaeocystis_antarctica.AAC.3
MTVAMRSSGSMGSSWCSGTPLAVREALGIRKAGTAYATPRPEMQRTLSCEEHAKTRTTSSSALPLLPRFMPALPRVPRRWAESSSSGRRLMKPSAVVMITALCSVMSSASVKSLTSSPISVRRGVAYLALSSASSSLMSSSTRGRSASSSCSAAVWARSVSASAPSDSPSSAVSRRSCIERMASACSRESPKAADSRRVRASAAPRACRMASTTSSRRESATSSPSTRCRRVSAFFSS